MLRLMVFAWLSLALSSVVLADSRHEGKHCQLTRYTSVPMAVQNGFSLVPADFDGHRVWLILQINGGASVVFEDAADVLHLTKRPIGVDSVRFGKQHIREEAVVRSLLIGTVRWDKAALLVVTPETSGTTGPDGAPIAGLMAMNFFQKIDFELDNQKQMLSLYSPDHCPGAVVYWSHDYASTPLVRGKLGNAYFPMELDGRKIGAVLDTVAQDSSLRTDVTRRLYGFDEHSEGVETHADASGNAVSQYRAMAITNGGLTVKEAHIRLMKPDPTCNLTGSGSGSTVAHYDCIGGEAPLHLGRDVISKLHLYVATKENMMYYTAADVVSEPATGSASGVSSVAPPPSTP